MSQAGSQPKGVPWIWIVVAFAITVIVASFFLQNSEGVAHYYMTVSEYLEDQPKYEGKRLKLAGHVKANTLKKDPGVYTFVLEDLGKEVSVLYKGIVPDTFKEGAEVVVEGRGRKDSSFEAVDLLAKCASKYQAEGLPPIEQMRGKSIR